MNIGKKIKESINFKYVIINLIIYAVVIFICTLELPFYIDAPGGLDNINEKVEVADAYKAKGSFNITYVSEYKAIIPMLIYAKLNKDWKIEPKSNAHIGTLDYEKLLVREQILMKESYTTSILYAYTKANKDVKIIKENVYITYVIEGAKTDLQVGDQIVSIDDIKINKYEDFSNIVANMKTDDTITIEVINNNKRYTRTATKTKFSESEFTGLGVTNSIEYKLETTPKYNFNYNKRELGPSAGLMVALAVYNSLTETDLTGGKKVAGTGTLTIDGKVGAIGGVEYKLKGAVKNKADIFLVPSEENYDEAIKIKEKNKYNIEIVKVATFDDALEYLMNNIVKK